MKALLPVTALALSFVGAASARADWQYTKWGMTPSQVVAASHGRAKWTTAVDPDGSKRTYLATVHQAGKALFNVSFGFDETGLISVGMDTVDCADLYMNLRSKYGDPVTTVRGLTPITTWDDKAGANRVKLEQFADECFLFYTPLKPEVSGL